MKQTAFAGCLAIAVFLGGCQTLEETLKDNPKQAGGTAIGAVIGGLIGSQFGSGTGQIVGTLVGVAAGGLIGSSIGAYLDEQDRKTAEASRNAALATGQTQTWKNPDTGVSGRAEVTEERVQSSPTRIAMNKDRVEEIPPIDLIGETYSATAKTNVRGGPGTDYKVVGSILPGEAVEVVGKVQEKDWFLVAEGGIANGFVSASYLKPHPNPSQSEFRSKSKAAEYAETAQVFSNRLCRTVTQTVSLANGSQHEEKVTACRGPDGWEVVKA